MKVLMIALSCILLVAQGAFAQNMIGYSKQEVKDRMRSFHYDEYEFSKEWVLDNGVHVIQYNKKSNPIFKLIYYLYDGICGRYMHMLPKEVLTSTIASLNKYHYHEGDNIWVSKDMTLKMELNVEEGLYIVIVTEKIQ